MFGLTILAWIFSVTTLAVCNFIKWEYVGLDSFGFSTLYSGESGLFTFNAFGECESYGDYDVDADGAHKAGKAFGILANLCLVFAFVGIALTIFFLTGKAAKIVWMSTRILYVMALLMVVLTFVFLATGDCNNGSTECSLGGGGVINALNVIVLVAIVSVCWCTPVPSEPVFKCCRSATGTQAAQSLKETNVTDVKKQEVTESNLERAEVMEADENPPSQSSSSIPEHLQKLQTQN